MLKYDTYGTLLYHIESIYVHLLILNVSYNGVLLSCLPLWDCVNFCLERCLYGKL